MPRRREITKREIVPDPKYKSALLSQFINVIMKDGKKSCAQGIVYEALSEMSEKLKKMKKSDDEEGGSTGSSSESKDPALKHFEEILHEVRPNVEVRSRRVGGATYQVPVEIPLHRSIALGMRWIAEAARLRGEQGMKRRLAGELVDAYSKKGGAIKKRDNAHQMAKANAAFAHFKWNQ